MTCPHLDDVVALFLDGDFSSGGASLEAHAAECHVCGRALAQSRHLDAAIAATVDAGLRDPDALVATAIAATDPAVPSAGRTPFRAWPFVLTAAASFAIGLGVAWHRTALPAPTAPENVAPPTPIGIQVPREPTGLFTIPDQAAAAEPTNGWTSGARGLDAVRRAELILGSADLATAVEMVERARALSLGIPRGSSPLGERLFGESLFGETVGGPTGETAARVEAARVLLASRARAATVALARALARNDATAAALRPTLADDREFKVRLRRELHERCDLEVTLAAVALADPDLDRAVIARCRRDEPHADAIAASVRTTTKPAARVEFLFELWSALARVGADGNGPRRDDADRANTWFAGLGPDACARVVTRLHASRSGELRGQCILALAAIADPGALEPLLALIERPNLHEAQLATYALGMLPQAVIPRLRVALPRSRRATLLWTALAGLGDRGAGELVAATGIPFDPTTRLRPEQVAAIAHALRGRESGSPTSSRP